MRYQVQRLLLGLDNRIDLTESDWIALRAALNGAKHALAIEEKYDLVVRNEMAFERSVLDAALENLFRPSGSWSEFMNHVQESNLVLMNLLSTCRMYVDHVPQHLAAALGESSTHLVAFSKAVQDQYDSRLGYRALYELRNHAQHAALPVQAFSLDSSWVETQGACRHIAIPQVQLSDLSANGKFKKKVLHDLEKIGDRMGHPRFLGQSN